MFVNRVKENPFITQSLKTMLLRIIGVGTLFGFSLFLTHNYDPKIIGQYDFIRVVLLVLGSICILGTDQSILFFAGILKNNNNYSEIKKVYYKMLLLIGIMSLLIGCVFLAIGPQRIANFLNDQKVYNTLLKSVLVLFFYSVTLFNTEVFRALESVYIAELFRNIFKYVSIILGSVVLFTIHKESYLIDTFLVGFIFLSMISTAMIYSYFAKKNSDVEPINYSYTYIIKKSYPIAISTMAIFLLSTLDVMFLKKYYGDKVVAQYGIGVKIMAIIAMIIQMININISSKIASLFFAENQADLKKTIKNSVRILAVFIVPCLLVVVVFSKQIVGVFGPEYLEVEKAMLILILGQGMIALCGIAPVYLNMTGRQHVFQIVLLVSVVLNLMLNAYLIPIHGMEGAAVSFVISMLFWNIIVVFIAYKKDGIKIFLH